MLQTVFGGPAGHDSDRTPLSVGAKAIKMEPQSPQSPQAESFNSLDNKQNYPISSSQFSCTFFGSSQQNYDKVCKTEPMSPLTPEPVTFSCQQINQMPSTSHHESVSEENYGHHILTGNAHVDLMSPGTSHLGLTSVESSTTKSHSENSETNTSSLSSRRGIDNGASIQEVANLTRRPPSPEDESWRVNTDNGLTEDKWPGPTLTPGVLRTLPFNKPAWSALETISKHSRDIRDDPQAVQQLIRKVKEHLHRQKEQTEARETPSTSTLRYADHTYIAQGRRHSVREYKCNTCNKVFAKSRRHRYLSHIRTHTGEKPFKCTVCGRGFNRQDHVQVHMRLHTGEKPFQCSVCHVAYAHKVSLKNHKCENEQTKVSGKRSNSLDNSSSSTTQPSAATLHDPSKDEPEAHLITDHIHTITKENSHQKDSDRKTAEKNIEGDSVPTTCPNLSLKLYLDVKTPPSIQFDTNLKSGADQHIPNSSTVEDIHGSSNSPLPLHSPAYANQPVTKETLNQQSDECTKDNGDSCQRKELQLTSHKKFASESECLPSSHIPTTDEIKTRSLNESETLDDLEPPDTENNDNNLQGLATEITVTTENNFSNDDATTHTSQVTPELKKMITSNESSVAKSSAVPNQLKDNPTNCEPPEGDPSPITNPLERILLEGVRCGQEAAETSFEELTPSWWGHPQVMPIRLRPNKFPRN